MSSLDTIPSVLGTTPAALGSMTEADDAATSSIWMKGVFWIALSLLAWGGYGYFFK